MPGTMQEIVALVGGLVARTLPPEAIEDWRWADGEAITAAEQRDVRALFVYVWRQRTGRHRQLAQRKARRLLRRLLSPAQRSELSRLRYFYVTASSGTTYRLDPRRGLTEKVERHGRRWFVKRAYCLHADEDEDTMPPADLTIAHLLWLLADEPAFLVMANEERRDDQLWNRDYLRRMRGRHRAPAGAAGPGRS